jgi:hypothetical protein
MKELERIARELCIADGHDPNLWSLEHADKSGAFGRIVLHGEPQRQWELYQHLVSEGIRSLVRGFESQNMESSLERYALAVLKGVEIVADANTGGGQGPQRAYYGVLPRP